MRKQLIYHDKVKKKLFDYFVKDEGGTTKYILTVDGKQVYEDDEPLTEIEMQRMIRYYSIH